MVFDINGELDYIIFPEGRILPNGGSFTYEYHLKDHLGSVRLAFRTTGSGKSVVQMNSYYPSGAPIADFGYSASDNRYKHTGMETIEDFSLGYVDNGARWRLNNTAPMFMGIDPMAEKNPHISPYVYCSNNPILRVDPTGMLDGEYLDNNGKRIGWDGNDDDKLYLVTDKTEVSNIVAAEKTGKSVSLDKVTSAKQVLSRESITGDPRENKSFTGIFNESFTPTKQAEMRKDALSPYDGKGSIFSISKFLITKSQPNGNLDFRKSFTAGELINLNGTYMNNHEALNYMWGAALSEFSNSHVLGKGDALIGAQLFHMYDNIFGRSTGWANQSNHNEAIRMGWDYVQTLNRK